MIFKLFDWFVWFILQMNEDHHAVVHMSVFIHFIHATPFRQSRDFLLEYPLESGRGTIEIPFTPHYHNRFYLEFMSVLLIGEIAV